MNRAVRWILWCLLASLGNTLSASGQESTSPASSPPFEPLRFRRLMVPEELIPKWFPGHRPLQRDKFEAELQRLNSRVAVAAQATTKISRATYRARLVGGEYLAGEVDWEIARSLREPLSLTFAVGSLAFSEPRWTDGTRDIVPSGVLADGTWSMLIDRDGTARSEWSLAGQAGEQDSRVFAFRIPRSAASFLVLELPLGWEPRVNRGVLVRRPGSPGTADGTWEIALGGTDQFELQLWPRREPAATRAPRVRELSRYRLTTAGLELRTSLRLETDGQPLTGFPLSVSPGLNIAAVHREGQSLALARRDSNAGEGRIEVLLDEPLTGASQEFLILAYAPIEQGKFWELPRVRLEDGDWLSGQATLEVLEPLSLAALEMTEGSETKVEPLPAPEVGELRQVEYWSAAGTTRVWLTQPPGEIDAAVSTAIRFSELASTAQMVVELQARRGAHFTLRGQVAPGWTVDAVQAQPPELLDNFSTEGSGRQNLVVRLRRAIPAEQKCQLLIRAHRRAPRIDSPLRSDILGVIAFRQVTVREQITALSAEPPLHAHLTGDEHLRRVNADDLPPALADQMDGTGEPVLFRHPPNAGPWSVQLSREQPRFLAHVRHRVTLDARSATEETELRCEPNQSFVSRLLVHMSRGDSLPLEWRLLEPGDNRVSARLFSASPDGVGGEAWEVSLARPLNRPFTVTWKRQQPNQANLELTFSSLPEAVSQTGIVEIHARGAPPFEVRSRNLQAVAAVALDGDRLPTLRGAYHFSPSQQVAATLTPLPADTVSCPAWIWQMEMDSRGDANGEWLHESRFHLENIGLSAIQITLPPGATLARAAVDDGVVAANALRAGGPLSIPLPKDRRYPLVDIVYRTSGKPWGLFTTVECVPPTSDLSCLRTISRVWLPADYQAHSPTRSEANPVASSDLAWDERLCGRPLWRRHGRPFSPFAAADWQYLGEQLTSLLLPVREEPGSAAPPLRAGNSEPALAAEAAANRLWTGVPKLLGESPENRGDLVRWEGTEPRTVVLHLAHRPWRRGMGAGLALAAAGIAAWLNRRRAVEEALPRLQRTTAILLVMWTAAVLVAPVVWVDLVRLGWLGALAGTAWSFRSRNRAVTARASASPDRSQSFSMNPSLAGPPTKGTAGSQSVTIVRSPLGMCLLAAVTALSSSLTTAQELSPTSGAATVTVVSPIDAQRQPKGDYLFVPQRLYDLLHQPDADPVRGARGSWLEAIEHHLTLAARPEEEGGVVPREYAVDLHVRVWETGAVVAIPGLGDRMRWLDVQIDGQSRLDLLAVGGESLQIPLDEVGTHRVRVVGRPQPSSLVGGEFAIPVAKCPRARVLVTAPGLAERVEIAGAAAPPQRDLSAGTVTAVLGPRSDLAVRWSGAPAPASEPIDTEVTELWWLHVQNQAVNLHATYRFTARNANSNALGQVTIVADGRLRLLPIDKSQPIAFVEVVPGEKQLIRCWLDRPSATLTLRLAFAVPGGGGLGRWMIPELSAVASRRVPTWVGITVTEGLLASLEPVPAVGKLAPSDFLAAWGESPEPPQQAFSLPPGTRQLSLAVRPVPPRLEAQEEQSVLVSGGQAEYSYDALITADPGRITQLSLTVPPRFTPREVTVLHDDANRLLRWAAAGDRQLGLFFTGPLAGQIHVLVQGTSPLPLPQRSPLPLLSAQGTATRRRGIQLLQGDDVTVTVDDSTGLRTDSRAAAPAGKGRLVATFLGSEADPTTEKLQITTRPNQPRVVGSLATRMLFEDDRWKAVAELHLAVQQGTMDTIRLRVPADWGGRLQLVPPVAYEAYPAPGEAGRLLILQLPAAVDREFHLTLSGELQWDDEDPVRVPELQVLDLAALQRYLILPTQLRQQKAVWETSGLQSTELPEEHVGPTPDEAVAIYRAIGPRVQATLREVERPTGSPQVALADYHLRWISGQRALGAATFYLEPSRLAEVVVRIPAGARPIHFQVAGLPTAGRRVRDGAWRVPVGPELLPQLIEVLYELPVESGNSPTELVGLAAPVLAGVPCLRTSWSVEGWPHAADDPAASAWQGGGEPVLLHTMSTPEELEQIRHDTLVALRERGLSDASRTNVVERETWRNDWDARLASCQRRLQRLRTPGTAQDEPAPTDDSLLPRDLNRQWLADELVRSRTVYSTLAGEAPRLQLRPLHPTWNAWTSTSGRVAGFAGLLVAVWWGQRRRGWREFWHRSPHLVIAAGGLLWWLFFTPGIIGLSLLAAGALSALRPRWRTLPG